MFKNCRFSPFSIISKICTNFLSVYLRIFFEEPLFIVRIVRICPLAKISNRIFRIYLGTIFFRILSEIFIPSFAFLLEILTYFDRKFQNGTNSFQIKCKLNWNHFCPKCYIGLLSKIFWKNLMQISEEFVRKGNDCIASERTFYRIFLAELKSWWDGSCLRPHSDPALKIKSKIPNLILIFIIPHACVIFIHHNI